MWFTGPSHSTPNDAFRSLRGDGRDDPPRRRRGPVVRSGARDRLPITSARPACPRSGGVVASTPRCTSHHCAAAVAPRLVSTEYPRRGRGGAAARLRGRPTSQPRRRRDSSPRNIHVAAAVATRTAGVRRDERFDPWADASRERFVRAAATSRRGPRASPARGTARCRPSPQTSSRWSSLSRTWGSATTPSCRRARRTWFGGSRAIACSIRCGEVWSSLLMIVGARQRVGSDSS